VFGKNFLRVISAVWAGKIWLLYKVAGFIQKNVAPDLADTESKGGTLERWGRLKLNRNPFTATAGQYTVSVTGTVGAVILAKTTFKSDTDSANPGKLFILDTEFELETSPDQIVLRALEVGLDSQLEVNDLLVTTIPIAGVDRTVTVVSETVEPSAAETLEDYRVKVVEAYRTEPEGGAVTDYRKWALDAQGVKTVYPYPAYGQDNEVDLYVEATLEDSVDGKGTPSAQLLTDVYDVVNFDPDDTKELNERGRRPMNVIVNMHNVLPRRVDINIADFENLDNAIETTITNALEELLADIRPFVPSADVLADRNDRLDVNRIVSKIYEAVPGGIFGAVTLSVNGAVVSFYLFENGDIPYLDNITFV
jgi:uncharacterized phage protein gp47/JayE